MGLDNDDIKQLIAILQRGLSNNTQEEDNEDEVASPPVKKSKSKNRNNNKPKKKYTNKFESMPEFGMCKEDVEIDRKIRKPAPSMRKPEFQFMRVQCRVCGKSEEVAPSLIETIDRYKCNKCATGAG